MLINNVEVTSTSLAFNVLEVKSRAEYRVYYDLEAVNILCVSCCRTRCEHVRFVESAFQESDQYIQQYIKDMSGADVDFTEITYIRGALRVALRTPETEIPRKPKREKTRKQLPSAFSMIEVDDEA